VHACTIGNNCLVGMGATVLDGVVVSAWRRADPANVLATHAGGVSNGTLPALVLTRPPQVLPYNLCVWLLTG
jgi:carbonic anhydrase/acetyltransferase-like protein (isoleucine patch superfamily)